VNFEHIQTVTLREYLLRTLPDKEAEAVEARYFSDGAFFKEMRAAEVQLICDYLDGRLNRTERAKFESRYLRVDVLRKRVENVRSCRAVPSREAPLRFLHVALAGILGCLAILGIAIMVQRHPKSPAPAVQIASVEPNPPGISMVLTPGVTKGSESLPLVLTLPDHRPQNVSLVAELPGQRSSATYKARLLNVDLDATHKAVWTATGIRSTPRTGGQQVIVKVPSASIQPGDYILELEMEGGSARETYVLRVSSPQKRTNDR